MHFVTSIFSGVHFSPGITPKTRMFSHRRGCFSMFCGAFRDIFFRSGSSSMFYPKNQDESPPPHNSLHVLWRFPGHFLLRWQFLHDLPPKPGCFPIATSFPPCFVAFSGTFFFAGAFSPCFAPKTRMFLHRPTISSMFCGVFRDILLQRQHFLPEMWSFPGYFLSPLE